MQATLDRDETIYLAAAAIYAGKCINKSGQLHSMSMDNAIDSAVLLWNLVQDRKKNGKL